MKFIFYLLIVFVALANESQATKYTANRIVDRLLDQLTRNRNVDPLHLEGVQVSKDFELMWVHGKIYAVHPEIDGLKGLFRAGDASVWNETSFYGVRGHLAVRNVKIISGVHIDYGFLHPDFQLEIDFGSADATLALAFSKDSDKIELREFSVDDLNNISFHVEGLSVLNKVIEYVGKAYVYLFRDSARSNVANFVRPYLEKIFSDVSKSKLYESSTIRQILLS